MSLKAPLLLSVALVFGACSGGAAEESPLPARPTVGSTTTSTTQPTTTTSTTIPVLVEGAPEPLAALVTGFYDYAAGRIDSPPPLPDPVGAALTPSEIETPASGTASVATFGGQQVGVVDMAGDVFLAVDDGSGWRVVGGHWPSLGIAGYYGGAPRHVAVVGSDARPGQTVERSRADSIHFVALDGTGGGAIVGLPRDSYVSVPGHGKRKITASLALGGPETMMTAFRELTGLPLEGYVMTGFAGFRSLAGEVLGGITIDVPFAINDRWAHVTLRAGEQLLDGAQALGFARARKTVPRGDFTRSEHQGVLLLGAARTVEAMGYTALPRLMEMSEPHMLTNLTPEQLLTFSAMVIAADIEQISNEVAPGSTGSAGGASVVFLSNSVDELFADLADGRRGN